MSLFHYRLREGKPVHYRPWSPKERHTFERYQRPEELLADLFSDSVDHRRSAMGAMESIMHMRRTLKSYFRDEEYLETRRQSILFIGLQNRFDEDLVYLKELFHLPPEFISEQNAHFENRNPTPPGENANAHYLQAFKDMFAMEYRLFDKCVELRHRILES